MVLITEFKRITAMPNPTASNTSSDVISKSDEMLNLRLEYDKTQQMAIHYDLLNWNIGYILIAGVFVGVGLVGEKIFLYPALALISLATLTIWRLFYARHKKIQRVKFIRLQEIEKELNMQQHRRVHSEDREGKLGGLKGDQLATILTLGIPSLLMLVWLVHPIFIRLYPEGFKFP
jgi:hypothetical protein